MTKYWKVGTKEDRLSYYVVAPNRNVAIRLVEQIVGPFNPSRVLCTELPQAPRGYNITGDLSQSVLEEDPDYEG
jgi:hypothetical protein